MFLLKASAEPRGGSGASLSSTKVGDVVSVKLWNGGTQSYVKIQDNRFAAIKDGKLYSIDGHHNMYSVADSNEITGIMNTSAGRGVNSRLTVKSGVYTESQLSKMKMEAQGIGRIPRRPIPTRGR